MKILNLKAQGFRSLKSIDWSPGDLNVLIGPNAGGKSNLLQLLELLTASVNGNLNNYIKEKGGIQSLVWNAEAEIIKIKIHVTHPKTDTSPKFYFVYELAIRKLISGLYEIENENLHSFDNINNQEILNFNRKKIIDEIIHHPQDSITHKFKPTETILSSSETLGASVEICKYFFTLVLVYSYFNTEPESPTRQATITSHETHINKYGDNFINVLHTLYEENRQFHDEINNAMKAAFPDFEKLAFPSAGGDGRIQLAVWWKSLNKPQYSYQLSDGTLRFLYLMTILANPSSPFPIAIDEPETGLHPAMLPIIAEYAVQASRRTQVILSTHSPEMLSAFGDHQKDVTVTVAEWKDGQTQLRILDGVKLNYWLKDYALGELFRSGELEGM